MNLVFIMEQEMEELNIIFCIMVVFSLVHIQILAQLKLSEKLLVLLKLHYNFYVIYK